MSIKISSQFDAGAIDVVNATSANAIDLNIRKDSHADITQWFYFRLQGAQAQPCTIRLLNAGQSAYPKGWEDYHAMASYDRVHWFRVPTRFDGQVLTIEHTPAMDSVYYAYFEPYSWERHLALLGRADASPCARVGDLGTTAEGRDLNVVTVGSPGEGKKSLWVIARQHPGETMAEWFVEGMLDRLLDASDPVARALMARATLHIVPNMNPDGSARGNLRTNATGANLNREWMAPSLERSPEVFHVRAAMQATGIDGFLDVHGDEGLPYVFTDGNERLANYSPRMAALEQGFKAALQFANPDFQTIHGYPSDKETKVNLTIASKWVGHTFGGLALTLEMPFKDNAERPDPVHGWNGARSRRLGADALVALHALLPSL